MVKFCFFGDISCRIQIFFDMGSLLAIMGRKTGKMARPGSWSDWHCVSPVRAFDVLSLSHSFILDILVRVLDSTLYM